MGQLFTVLVVGAVLFLLDIYLANGFVGAFKKSTVKTKKIVKLGYLLFSFLLIAATLCCIYLNLPVGVRAMIMLGFFVLEIIKITFLLFVAGDDVRRLFIWSANKKTKVSPLAITPEPGKDAIPRSAFLMKAGLLAGAVPLASLGYLTEACAYDYRLHRQTLYLPNLPKKFDGIRLGQLSDIHSGSFYNKKAVRGGVEMLMREKPDFIFFTGDLVNAVTPEFNPYFDIFNKVKAPLGVYSCLGNHDYGDYAWWDSPQAKAVNLQWMKDAHKNLGWDLLLNDNRRLKVDGEEIGILGCENWGELTRFPKYGKMEPTVKNTDDLPVKLLLSHDPSHWQAQILPQYPQIDAMFSGHTHGMQFGVRTANFQWSPIEYIYKEWAGHYRQGNQQLYVNVGYGFIGLPGRVGILPEITIFELRSAHDPLQKKV